MTKVENLISRAKMLQKARAFFSERNVLEVDCPLLSKSASVDQHIDLIQCQTMQKETRYLHSSPEYGMKRLLAEGMPDIYQISHVFRDHEYGSRHNPEFMMAEWYRKGISFEEMMKETCDFIRLFVGDLLQVQISYKDVFLQYVGFNPFEVTDELLLQFLEGSGILFSFCKETDSKDDLLMIIMSEIIEPLFPKEKLIVVPYFPPTQAALAAIRKNDGDFVAERFEVYSHGLELANGYHELCHSQEQRQRFENANEMRALMGKNILPIDEHFLQALNQGLPDCCGVAVGFDRLMMIRRNTCQIKDVICFDWEIS